MLGIFLEIHFFYCSLYEESAESLHQLSDKLPAPGNAITFWSFVFSTFYEWVMNSESSVEH